MSHVLVIDRQPRLPVQVAHPSQGAGDLALVGLNRTVVHRPLDSLVDGEPRRTVNETAAGQVVVDITLTVGLNLRPVVPGLPAINDDHVLTPSSKEDKRDQLVPHAALTGVRHEDPADLLGVHTSL